MRVSLNELNQVISCNTKIFGAHVYIIASKQHRKQGLRDVGLTILGIKYIAIQSTGRLFLVQYNC